MVNRRSFFGGVVAAGAGLLSIKLPKVVAEMPKQYLVWYIRRHNDNIVAESQPADHNFDKEAFAKNCPGFLVYVDEKEVIKRLMKIR